MKYFIADEIKNAQKFFTDRIYVDFGGYGKYAEDCTYDELSGYAFNEFEASVDEYGNNEVLVTIVNTDETVEQNYITFDDIYYDMVVTENFRIDTTTQKISVK